MKLRLVERGKERVLLCPNGSVMRVDRDVLDRLLTDFKKAKTFRGDYGFWNADNSSMEEAAGITLAFVDDANKLIILSDKLFSPEKQIVYVSATEYAEMHGKCRATIKNLCVAGRIPGAYKTSSGWLIPKDSPYPDRKARETK